MAAILVILFSVILSSMTPLVFEASDQLIPIVFEVDKTLGQYLSTASSKNTYTFIVNESEMRKQKEQLLQSNEYRWAQAIDDLTLFKNILGEKNQLIADLYREKSELEEANKELDEVIKTQAKQIEELNAKLNPDKHVHSQEQGMYPTL